MRMWLLLGRMRMLRVLVISYKLWLCGIIHNLLRRCLVILWWELCLEHRLWLLTKIIRVCHINWLVGHIMSLGLWTCAIWNVSVLVNFYLFSCFSQKRVELVLNLVFIWKVFGKWLTLSHWVVVRKLGRRFMSPFSDIQDLKFSSRNRFEILLADVEFFFFWRLWKTGFWNKPMQTWLVLSFRRCSLEFGVYGD